MVMTILSLSAYVNNNSPKCKETENLALHMNEILMKPWK